MRESCGRRHGAWVAGLVALALATGACGRGTTVTAMLNEPPVVELTQAPASSDQPYFYAYEIFWTGFDPDGRIDYFLYTVDPPTAAGSETTWVRTTDNRKKFFFHSGDPDSLGTTTNPGGFHVFAIKAVDDRGAESPLLSRAFFTYTVGPTVTFIQPRAAPLLFPKVPPTTAITWTGDDPDGQTSRKPVYYRYALFSGLDAANAAVNPDGLRRRFAPDFASWDSVAGDTVTVRFTNLTPDGTGAYMLVVVAFDEAGAYSPVFTIAGNMLYFYCQYASFGPKFTVFNDFFTYSWLSGGYNPDPINYAHVEVPAGQRVPFHWYATPEPGTQMRRYRWALDIQDLTDETPRSNESTDLVHWSQWGLTTTTALIGPFDDNGTHLLMIEGEDENGLHSLAIVETRIVRASFDKPILFVDDTRFTVDQKLANRDSIRSPGPGNWPSAAELDTFFFAHGGVRWRYYPNGTVTEPGIFKGYTYDTLGTRHARDGVVPLATLAQYEAVIWYVDPAATFIKPPYDTQTPQPSLRWISSPGHSNALATYVRLGGKVWLMGGGGAFNSLHAYNATSNDGGGVIVWGKPLGELIPGRMLYDRGGWRSEITGAKAVSATAYTGAAQGRVGSPDYAGLPAVLDPKTAATDPLSPVRSPSTFYLYLYDGEFISQPNLVVEDIDPDPEVDRLESVLDTLYLAQGSLNAENRPIMTYYHGGDGGGFVFSGFPLWFFQRQQAMDLGDFVLQNIFGFTREPLPR